MRFPRLPFTPPTDVDEDFAPSGYSLDWEESWSAFAADETGSGGNWVTKD